MEEKTKHKWMIAQTISLTVTSIVLILFIATVFQNGSHCLSNPLVYGAKILSDSNKPAEFSCICQFSNAPEWEIKVNKTGWIYHKFNDDGLPYGGFNWTVH